MQLVSDLARLFRKLFSENEWSFRLSRCRALSANVLPDYLFNVVASCTGRPSIPGSINMSGITSRFSPQLRRQLFRSFSTSRSQAADHARIVEVGPRDGLQNEKKSIPLPTKLELIQRLAKTGVTHLEAGSFVPAKWVPQVNLCAH